MIDVELLPLIQRRPVPYNSPIPAMAGARKELQEVLSLPAPAPHLRTQTLTHRRNGSPCTHLPGVRRWLWCLSATIWGLFPYQNQTRSKHTRHNIDVSSAFFFVFHLFRLTICRRCNVEQNQVKPALHALQCAVHIENCARFYMGPRFHVAEGDIVFI
jgi:hypothetical protein